MWTALAGRTGRRRQSIVALGMLLLQQLLTAAYSQPVSSGPAQQALRDFCQTFSGRHALCGRLRRAKRSNGLPWGDLLTNSTVNMPDTKWCGAGNTASGYDDLGQAEVTDRCCRDHDHCPVYLIAGQSRGGATNTGTFTTSGCECDAEFFDCLVEANTAHSQLVGELYFNILRPACIKTGVSRACIKTGVSRCSRREGAEQDQDHQERAERLRLVKSPLVGQFPEPFSEETMLDEAEDLLDEAENLVIRVWTELIKGR